MAKVKNTSPFGDLFVPTLGVEVAFGEVIDVADDVAASLLEQPFHWSQGDSKSAPAPAEASTSTEGN